MSNPNPNPNPNLTLETEVDEPKNTPSQLSPLSLETIQANLAADTLTAAVSSAVVAALGHPNLINQMDDDPFHPCDTDVLSIRIWNNLHLQNVLNCLCASKFYTELSAFVDASPRGLVFRVQSTTESREMEFILCFDALDATIPHYACNEVLDRSSFELPLLVSSLKQSPESDTISIFRANSSDPYLHVRNSTRGGCNIELGQTGMPRFEPFIPFDSGPAFEAVFSSSELKNLLRSITPPKDKTSFVEVGLLVQHPRVNVQVVATGETYEVSVKEWKLVPPFNSGVYGLKLPMVHCLQECIGDEYDVLLAGIVGRIVLSFNIPGSGQLLLVLQA